MVEALPPGTDTVASDVTIVLTLLLLEAVLSFDNAAILAAMVRKLPLKDRKKALLYGLVGAYALRIGAIFAASLLIQTPVLKIIGGAYLLFLTVKHFVNLARRKEGEHHHDVKPSLWLKLGIPTLAATIIQIELIDLAFAIDQVIVAVAFTEKIHLIIVASVLGILFLRLAAAVMARVMDWLPTLEHMAYVAVGYVGLKLILLHPVFVQGDECVVPFLTHHVTFPDGAVLTECEIPTLVSVGITLTLFLVPVFVKLVFGIPRSHPPAAHEAASTTEPPTVAPTMQTLQDASRDVAKGSPRIDRADDLKRP